MPRVVSGCAPSCAANPELRTKPARASEVWRRVSSSRTTLSSRVAIVALSLAALQCGTSDASWVTERPSPAGAGTSGNPSSTAPAVAQNGASAAGSQPVDSSVNATDASHDLTPAESATPGKHAQDDATPERQGPSDSEPDASVPEVPANQASDPEGSTPDDPEYEQPSTGDDPPSDPPASDETSAQDPADEDPWPEELDTVEPVAPPPIEHIAARFVPPLPTQIAQGAGLVRNRDWALVLGKALFWDAQIGSDGQACGSCHFNAGADSRISGELNPGFLDQTRGPGGDVKFGSDRSDTGAVAAGKMPSGNAAGPNTTLVASDFPLHRLLDETQRDSTVVSDTDDVVGSIGAFAAVFAGIDSHGAEHCTDVADPVFAISGAYGKSLATRQVEPRNTPTTINSAFNKRQFWDGRANNTFNGVGVFGQRDIAGDPNLRLILATEGGSPVLGALSLENASLASQAVGPPLSSIEMSCAGRTFAELGRKISRITPLAGQHIDPTDSVLGGVANLDGPGFVPGYSYSWLIQQAFDPRYWSVPGKFRIAGGALTEDESGYSQLETNMSMFWGIAIMLYESTLISDKSEFDDLFAAGDIQMPNCNANAAVDPLLARGCKIFFRSPFGAPPADGVRGAGCAFCHSGTDLFSEAAAQANVAFPPMLQVADVNAVIGTRDLGFANIGLRPAFVDVGLGGTDPYGNPLAFGRQYRQFALTGNRSVVSDPFLLLAIDNNALVRNGAVNNTAKLESDGSTKIPSIRNSALTAPYFSYGGYASLRQVMKFYNRGGNRRQLTADSIALERMPGSTCLGGDNTGTGPDGDHFFPVQDADCNTNVTGLMRPLGLLDCDANGVVTCDVATDDLSAVVRFMESLTDRRVQCDQAPFDHPELSLPHGHTAAEGALPGTAAEQRFLLPAVGATGYAPSSGLCIPNSGDLFAPGMQGRVGGLRVPLAP
jgi:cytochrome c peroxidase